MENTNPSELIYTLTDSHDKPSTKFELKKKNGTDSTYSYVELVTKGKLDIKESPYDLIVTVFDGSINMASTLSSQKFIRVHVMNKGSVNVWVNKDTGMSVDYYVVSHKILNFFEVPNETT